MAADTLPVVRIKSDAPGHQPDGFVEINESDFDPAAHQLFTAPPKAPEPKSKGGKAAKQE